MILRTGTKSELVKKLQAGLAYLGYHPGPIDGHFGNMTEDAVEAFQKKSKIYNVCIIITKLFLNNLVTY